MNEKQTEAEKTKKMLIIQIGNKNTKVWFEQKYFSFPTTITFFKSTVDKKLNNQGIDMDLNMQIQQLQSKEKAHKIRLLQKGNNNENPNQENPISMNQLKNTIIIGNQPFWNYNRKNILLYQFTGILGLKFNDPHFQKSMKYFSSDFVCGKDYQIEAMLGNGARFLFENDQNDSLSTRFKNHVQLEILLALVVKMVFQEIWKTNVSGAQNISPYQYFSSLKIVAIIPPPLSHPCRLSLKTVFQIALESLNEKNIKKSNKPKKLDIQLDFSQAKQYDLIFIKSTSSIVVDFYTTKYHTPQSQTIIPKWIGVIDFSDRYFNFAVYRVSSQENIIDCFHYENNNNGGQLLTRKIVDYVSNKLSIEKGLDIKKNLQLMSQLFVQCQNAKISLSRQKQACVRVQNLPDQTTFVFQLTRQKFENLIQQLVQENINMINRTVINFKKLHTFLVSGGSTQIPIFKRLLIEKVGHDRIIWMKQQSYVRGASFLNRKTSMQSKKSKSVSQDQIFVLQRNSTSIYLQCQQQKRVPLILKNEYVPKRLQKELRFPPGNIQFKLRIFQEDNQKKIAEYIVTQNLEYQNYYFQLFFQMNANGLLTLYGSSKKGKIMIEENLRNLNREDFLKALKIVNRASVELKQQ